MLRVFKGHRMTVSCCAVSADGTIFVSGSLDGTLKVWAIDRDQPLHTLSGHTGEVRGCAIAADGGSVLSRGERCHASGLGCADGRLSAGADGA